MFNIKLLEKYDIPAPRYTSYPTVPYWQVTPSTSTWIDSLNKSLEGEASWSLYLHIPFCENLCTFCGCNTIITRNHDGEQNYIDLVHQEWQSYLSQVPAFKTKPLRQLHLGGGTPTFLSASNLKKLLEPMMQMCHIDQDHFEGSIEVDPRKTNKEQLKVLKELGFNRISLGVQDFNHKVQEIVNRVQSYELTKEITDDARALGFGSVNFDLIYGLPCQGPEEIAKTVDLTLTLRPERIALYSFALVPWIKPQQRKFTDDQVAKGAEKRKLYEISREKLLAAGYQEIGMDHFALPEDELFHSIQNKTLHRNFMGYTPYETDVLLGLGVSSISESKTCFHQNEKVLKLYQDKVKIEGIPTLRGHIHSDEDLRHRKLILELMTTWQLEIPHDLSEGLWERLAPLKEDGLVDLKDQTLVITDQGKPFIRNICMALDKRMLDKKPLTQIFSQSM
jgi:oxygen-independent coproporphyrinogen-3 oxidase